jgi:hypothetical protein
MNHNEPVLQESIRQLARRNRLWLVVMPPLLSLVLVGVVKPGGRFASGVRTGNNFSVLFILRICAGVQKFQNHPAAFLGWPDIFGRQSVSGHLHRVPWLRDSK